MINNRIDKTYYQFTFIALSYDPFIYNLNFFLLVYLCFILRNILCKLIESWKQ